MRFKRVVEPPATLDAVADAQRAVPLVPAGEADCCRRLVDRTDETGIDDRDGGRQWLTFLRALGLVDEVASGYRRCRVELTAEELVDRLLDGVYGARELYDVLAAADRPLSLDDLGEAVGLPTWERHHHTDHEQVRRRRVRRLAEWFVLCGVAENESGRYRLNK